MKKLLLLFLVLSCLLVVALGGVAGATPPTLKGLAPVVASKASAARPVWAPLSAQPGPSVSTVAPVSAPNDIDTPVVISGSGFAAVMDGTGTVVLTAPTVSLGATPLTNVTFVDSTTLTATVPWGMDPGTYDLTVTNPDGGSGSLSGAFTVGAGIGQWNPGDLFGGQMQQLLMKPGDPNTLYATAYGVIGLFRSTDAGEHWTFVSDKAWANNNEVRGRSAASRLALRLRSQRSHALAGRRRHLDHARWRTSGRTGVTFRPIRRCTSRRTRTRPTRRLSSSARARGTSIPTATGPKGLIKSTDGGTTWTIVPSLEGVPVQDIAFDPNDHSHMVLVTSDMQVYTSSDWGDTWTQVTTSGLTPSSLGTGRIDHLQSRRLRSVDRRPSDSRSAAVSSRAPPPT